MSNRSLRQVLTSAIALVMLAAAPWSVPAQTPAPGSVFSEMRWRSIGPFRGGRTRSAAGVASQPYTFYIGVCNGGVWKTTDAGRTWTPIFDDQPTQSIGSIAVAPSNPSVIYVGSGEGLHRPDLSVGDGVYKSTDAGRSWVHLGLRDGQQIPNIAVDPRNPDRLFVAVLGHPYGPNPERGIFRSTDGGRTFEKVLSKDDNTGGNDVDIDPANPDVVYATLWEDRQGPWENAAWSGSSGGVFKSTDGGTTWKPLTRGLPAGGVIQANLAISPANPHRLYAALAGNASPDAAAPGRGAGRAGAAGGGGRGGGGGGIGFYRSDDAGETWTQVTQDARPVGRIGGGDLAVPIADPRTPDVVYTASTVSWKSVDGGRTWAPFKGAPGGEDYQGGWVNPNNPDIVLLVADQGAVVTLNGGATWSAWYNQPTAQLYHVAADNAFPYRVCSGQQESGSACVASRGNYGAISDRDWLPVGVDEYGYVAPDPLNADLVYGGRSVTRFDRRTGQVSTVGPGGGGRGGGAVSTGQALPTRQVRTQPVVFSSADPHALFFANNYLWKTIDGGGHWQRLSDDPTRKTWTVPASVGAYSSRVQPAQQGVIYTIGPSPLDVNRIWIGTDDGVIRMTADSGAHWTDVTPPALTPWMKVFMIDAGHFDAATAYAAVNTLRLDDMRPHIYRTHDAGKTWVEIVRGMEDAGPVNAVREDPKRKGLLFASTERGVYVSFDDGERWQSLRLNLPASSVRDIIVKDNDLVAATHGRGFWILDDITPLRQWNAADQATALFAPAPAWRVRWNTSTDMPWPKEEPVGQNPPDGATISYFLREPATGPITIEIVQQDGRLVRRYASSDPAASLPDPAAAPVPLYWYRAPQALATSAGLHRWLWDVHYQPLPSAAGAGGGGGRGLPIAAIPYSTAPAPGTPWVAPGIYSVKLTANGKTYTQPITVKQDPRVKTPALVMQQVYTLTRSAYYGAIDARDAAQRAQNLRDQIGKLQPVAKGAAATALAALDKKIDTGALNTSGAALSGVMNSLQSADVAPTANQLNSMNIALTNFREAMAKWTTIRTVDLPPVNAALKAAGLTPLTIQ